MLRKFSGQFDCKSWCRLLIFALMMILLPTSYAASQTGQGKNKNVSSSEENKPDIAPGRAKEQFREGQRYFWGRGVPKDHKEAEKWFLLAANQGHVAAQNNLGLLYSSKGQKGYGRAIKWYRKAAENGSAVAKYNLGLMYRYGKGVRRDYVISARYIKESATDGFAKAQNSMGYVYRKGMGVEANYEKAKNWFTQAALQDYSVGQFNLGRMYLIQYVETPTKEIFQVAKKWLTEAANQGHLASQFTLGRLYETGQGVSPDFSMAWMWYSLADENGSRNANRKLVVLKKDMTPNQLNRAGRLINEWRREQKKAKEL